MSGAGTADQTAAPDRAAPLADTAAGTSRDAPWPVRTLSRKMVEYISRAPQVWVEGQIAQLSNRPNSGMIFLTLRDPSAEISLQVTMFRSVFASLPTPPREGDRVVVHGHFELYPARGSLSFRVDEIHPVGLGELLARLERLRKLLAMEGLTAADRKRPLPFLPQRVGLITGRASAAEQDVLTNARARWPAVEFRVEHTIVQGPSAVPQIIEALHRLDADPVVDVIIIARGGGSMEDLLPFSDETLCREVAAARTPVVSAIGHQPDHPILDDVADLRCSTPTDAGKRVVPDAAAETERLRLAQHRMRRALIGWVTTEQARLSRLTAAPALADPLSPLRARREGIAAVTDRSVAAITRLLETGRSLLAQHRAQLAVLGPAATLARGYAVVQALPDGAGHGTVLRSVGDAPVGTRLRIRLADGALLARSQGADETDRTGV